MNKSTKLDAPQTRGMQAYSGPIQSNCRAVLPLMSVILTKRVLFVSVKAPKIVHETKRVNSFDKTEKIKCQDLLTRFNYINDLFFYKEKKEGNL